MPTIKHEAFLDLENALSLRLRSLVRSSTADYMKELNDLIVEGDFFGAIDISESSFIEERLREEVSKKKDMLMTMAKAALFLGVSRFMNNQSLPANPTNLPAALRSTETFRDMPLRELQKAVDQAILTLTRDTAAQMSKMAKLLITQAQAIADDTYYAVSDEEREKFSPTALMAVAAALALAVEGAKTPAEARRRSSTAITSLVSSEGAKSAALTASLIISRASALGFLNESTALGQDYYMINEVLDGKTCPVCEAMNGKVFPVISGMAHVQNLLSIDDPQAHKLLAPWPSTSKASVEKLERSSVETLIELGLSTPPFHAGCRGIITPVQN